MCHALAAPRNPLLCIVPPHILREIARNGTAKEREIALRTLATDGTSRERRIGYDSKGSGTLAVVSPGAPRKHRTIYDGGGLEELPGQAVRKEGSRDSADIEVNEAYDGLGATWDFYYKVFQRNSIDDGGLPLTATVHYGELYDNAFWNGEQMVFGDGDDEYFNRFTISLDVIGHELTHGVTGHETKLAYLDQAGALNESISDVFGSLVKQYSLRQTAEQADWLIGAGLFTDRVKADGNERAALRSMKAPGTAYNDSVLGKDPQPARMADFVHTSQDNGGVHINSGIPNHAFFLVARTVGGRAWEHAGRIWYETLRDGQLASDATFTAFAQRTVLTAERLHGTTSLERRAVFDAWHQVGVPVPTIVASLRETSSQP